MSLNFKFHFIKGTAGTAGTAGSNGTPGAQGGLNCDYTNIYR